MFKSVINEFTYEILFCKKGFNVWVETGIALFLRAIQTFSKNHNLYKKSF